MKKYFILLSLLCMFCACHSEETASGDNEKTEIPLGPGDEGEKTNKPKGMWIDAHANFTRFEQKENVTRYLEKVKNAGLNMIYVDVKPGIGYALYDSDILPQLTKWGDESIKRDWDYLGFMIEEAERLDLDVIATISTMGFGATKYKEGIVYDTDKWDGMTQATMPDPSDPTNLIDMREQTDVDAAMLNPCLPEVQEFVISIVEEIVTKYPKLKGICLDYCRWYGGNYGFSDATMDAFGRNIGQKIENRNDIITSTGGVGKLYNKWIEFRSAAVTNLISNIRSHVKSINPQMELQLWASAHWKSRYSCGQNWASKKYVPTASGIYTSSYNQTGFADQLEAFVLGAYADNVWISEDPTTDWSVENFVNTYNDYTMGDCKVYGSIPAYPPYDNASKLSDAVYLCMKRTDGLMVFELSHVLANGTWDAIKEGINRVEK